MSNIVIALDAGHGGSDNGASFMNRKEKDDVLRLTMAIGNILENSGINVVYTRTNDEYETPFKKATDANNSGADYFVSIHRNSSETPNQYSGVETLVYNDDGIKAVMARNINAELENVGYRNLGVDERPNLVVLKRTQMPAVLVEVGFINNDSDNAIFDNNFDAIAQGIANGILRTIYSGTSKTDINDDNSDDYQDEIPDNTFNNIPDITPYNMPYNNSPYSNENMPFDNTPYNNENMPFDNTPYNNENIPFDGRSTKNIPAEEKQIPLYRVQIGAYRQKDNADRMLNNLLIEGFPAFIIYEDGYYKVQAGAFQYLANAIKLERRLRRFRYNTYIVFS